MGALLAQLANELGMEQDTLRTRILASDEALVPNYLRTAADGSTQAVFPGGIRINAVDVFAATDRHTHAVEWVRQADGALIAQIIGEDFTQGGLSPNNGVDTGYTVVHPGAGFSSPQPSYASVNMVAAAPGINGQNQVYTGLAIDGNFADNLYIQLHSTSMPNMSSFIQGCTKATMSRQHLMGGSVLGNGTKVRGDGGWTSSRNAVGDYTIDITNGAYGSNPNPCITCYNNLLRAGMCYFTSATQAKFKIFNTATGALVDEDFSFILYFGNT